MEISSSEVVPDTASQCKQGKFCLWIDSNFQGKRHPIDSTFTGCQDLDPYGFNDQVSSWYNHTGDTFWVYWDSGCPAGSKRFQAPHGARSSMMGGWNDNPSSICRGPSCQ